MKIYYLYSRLTSFRIITCVVHSPKPPPPLYKEGEMRFFKNGCNGGGGDGKFLLEMGDKSQEWGDGKFLKSLYIVGRGVLTPLFYEDLHILPIPPFSKVVQPSPKFPVTSNPHLHCSFCCHVSLAEWVITPHLMCYFT